MDKNDDQAGLSPSILGQLAAETHDLITEASAEGLTGQVGGGTLAGNVGHVGTSTEHQEPSSGLSGPSAVPSAVPTVPNMYIPLDRLTALVDGLIKGKNELPVGPDGSPLVPHSQLTNELYKLAAEHVGTSLGNVRPLNTLGSGPTRFPPLPHRFITLDEQMALYNQLKSGNYTLFGTDGLPLEPQIYEPNSDFAKEIYEEVNQYVHAKLMDKWASSGPSDDVHIEPHQPPLTAALGGTFTQTAHAASTSDGRLVELNVNEIADMTDEALTGPSDDVYIQPHQPPLTAALGGTFTQTTRDASTSDGSLVKLNENEITAMIDEPTEPNPQIIELAEVEVEAKEAENFVNQVIKTPESAGLSREEAEQLEAMVEQLDNKVAGKRKRSP